MDDSEFRENNFEPTNSYIFKEEPAKGRSGLKKPKVIPSSGIIKNSIPVFKAKLMNKNTLSKSKSEVGINFPKGVEQNHKLHQKVDSGEKTKEIEKAKPSINELVSKVNLAVPDQILSKNTFSSKFSKEEDVNEGEFSDDDSYILSQRQNTNLLSEEGDGEIHKLHMLQSLQALQYLKTITPPPISELKDKLVFLPASNENRKTLIFDMDETLIHCVDSIEEEDPQYVIKVMLEGEEVEAGINIRPYALECLEAVNQKFEVVVFTASHQTYADAVLDFLDPQKELIKKRLYRDS